MLVRRHRGRQAGPPGRRVGARRGRRRRPAGSCRGAGDKLEAALDRFGVDVAGRRCLDAGASTGGFTDCLLQRGATAGRGRGRRARPARPGAARTIPGCASWSGPTSGDLGSPPTWAASRLRRGGRRPVLHLAHRTVAPALAGALAAPGAELVVLVKPQFEAGRVEVSRGRGVIRDPAVRRAALRQAWPPPSLSQGATIMGAMASPVLGPAGNAEFLLHARAQAPPAGRRPRRSGAPGADAAIDAAVHRALDAAVSEAPDAAPRRATPPGTSSAGHGHHRLRRAPRPSRGGRDRGGAPSVARRAGPRRGAGARRRMDEAHGPTTSPTGVDLAVSLGGDGTMLRTVALACARRRPRARRQPRPPRLPHRGRAGRPRGAPCSASSPATTPSRSASPSRCVHRAGAAPPETPDRRAVVVLNEAVVEKTVPGHTIRVRGLDRRVAPSSPTPPTGSSWPRPPGSTAYNLSARGPILSPGLRAIVLTPVSPHMLFDRPVVLEPEQWVRLELDGPAPAVLVLDGQSVDDPRARRRRGVPGGTHPGAARHLRPPRLPLHPARPVPPGRPLRRARRAGRAAGARPRASSSRWPSSSARA